MEGEAEQIQGDELRCKEREKETQSQGKEKEAWPRLTKKMTRLRSPRGWSREEAVTPDMEGNIRNGMKLTCRKSQEEGKESK